MTTGVDPKVSEYMKAMARKSNEHLTDKQRQARSKNLARGREVRWQKCPTRKKSILKAA